MSTTPRIYVACLASYNNGVLHGAWIDASTDVDAMQADVDAMLRASKFPNVTVPDYEASAKAAGWTPFEPNMMLHADHAAFAGTWRDLCEEYNIPLIMVPSAEEFAIHDSEGLGNIGEYAGLAEVARRVEVVEVAEERDIPPAVLLEAMSDLGVTDADDFVNDQYDGCADSWRDFVEERIEDCYDMSEVPAWLTGHIDWDSIARDWEISGDWSAYRDGEYGQLYFFRSN